MANKILCGGFQIDGTSLVEQNGILKATATGLPDASEATNGQGLIVDDGEFVIGNLPQGLPDASEATNGQGLIVDDGEFVIGDLPQGLPTVTIADAGSTLYVDAEGKWAIKAPEQQQVEGN